MDSRSQIPLQQIDIKPAIGATLRDSTNMTNRQRYSELYASSSTQSFAADVSTPQSTRNETQPSSEGSKDLRRLRKKVRELEGLVASKDTLIQTLSNRVSDWSTESTRAKEDAERWKKECLMCRETIASLEKDLKSLLEQLSDSQDRAVNSRVVTGKNRGDNSPPAWGNRSADFVDMQEAALKPADGVARRDEQRLKTLPSLHDCHVDLVLDNTRQMHSYGEYELATPISTPAPTPKGSRRISITPITIKTEASGALPSSLSVKSQYSVKDEAIQHFFQHGEVHTNQDLSPESLSDSGPATEGSVPADGKPPEREAIVSPVISTGAAPCIGSEVITEKRLTEHDHQLARNKRRGRLISLAKKEQREEAAAPHMQYVDSREVKQMQVMFESALQGKNLIIEALQRELEQKFRPPLPSSLAVTRGMIADDFKLGVAVDELESVNLD
ncbi:hypothetical protein CYMTET_39297 [Cymbomonas tetramitiformis]|uniref:Uncharacterized protein n=1 Tax=Cymbomonas tetramitiformis TaxID=36881 RepID=A0AAE0F4S8_9CHLO|nr:hypothetical protein CYMTET_39297 [Cymbomonas tetramitiformis]